MTETETTTVPERAEETWREKINRERREMHARTEAQVTRIAAALSVETSEAWVAAVDREYSYPHAKLSSTSGEAILLTSWRQERRFSVGGTTPGDLYGYSDETRAPRPSDITVARDRDPRAIAKDIARRVLPAWRGYLQALRDARTAKDARLSSVEANVARIEKIVGLKGHVRRPGEDRGVNAPGAEEGTISYYEMPGSGWVTGTIRNDSVTLALRSIPVEMAERVLAIIFGQPGEPATT
jgi:hypothetical protein